MCSVWIFRKWKRKRIDRISKLFIIRALQKSVVFGMAPNIYTRTTSLFPPLPFLTTWCSRASSVNHSSLSLRKLSSEKNELMGWMMGRRGYPFLYHSVSSIGVVGEHYQPYLDRKTLAVARFAPHHPYLFLMIPGSRWSLRHPWRSLLKSHPWRWREIMISYLSPCYPVTAPP